MKRLTRKRKRYLRRRSIRAERARRKAKQRRGSTAWIEQRRAQQRAFERIQRAPTRTVTAPSACSLIDHPVETVRFLNEIESACAGGSNVLVDLGDVTALTPEAVAVLLSRVRNDRFTKGMRVSGTVPREQTLAEILAESGFFDHVVVRGPRPKTNGIGEIRTRKSFKVDAASSFDLLQQVNQFVPGTEFAWDGIQRVIVESMNNTENHAGGQKKGRERWWLSVYCDREAGVARFCFFDNGVGIFESLKKKGLLSQLFRALGLQNREALLRKILAGEVRSSTGLGYRGKGLPKIAAAFKRKQFERLVILSNDVYANLAADEVRTLPVSFSGTFLYWEHHAN
ncbi:MAG: hypothetical protein AAF624_00560 [Bacteroidota bacterium]